MLSDDERRELLRAARESIAHAVAGGSRPEPPRLDHPGLRRGAFVSLHLHGDLRGCIGHPAADRPLADVVPECAVAAATTDPRFPPVSAGELAEVHIEISVLTPIEPVTDPSEIEVGRDGLVAELGYRRGLLLPQVASERAWSRDTFLAHTCLKAGLSPDAWKSGARLFRFQAEVFAEPRSSSSLA